MLTRKLERVHTSNWISIHQSVLQRLHVDDSDGLASSIAVSLSRKGLACAVL